jgi:hypothetical protein
VSVVSINVGNLFDKGSNGQESTRAKHIDPLILQCFNGMLLKARDVQKRQVRIPLSPPASLTCRETLASIATKSAKQAHFSQSLLDKTRLQRMHYPAARWPLRGFSLKHQRAVEF